MLKTPPKGMETLTQPSSWHWFHLMEEAMTAGPYTARTFPSSRNIVRKAVEVDRKLAELQRERRALDREQAKFDRELLAFERDESC